MTISTLVPTPATADMVMMAGRTTGGTDIDATSSFAVVVDKAIVRIIIIEGIHVDELHALLVTASWYCGLRNERY
jgi:hypothetical protein